MASEIKVDTVSEKTSGSGVSIDGLLIKDGGISGDVSLIGTTPTFTIGDAGAEDAALVFDGNAQDFYVGLDDSSDSLVMGLGSALGTTPAITINSSQVATLAQRPVFSSGITIADAGQIGSASDADAIAIASNGVVTFSQNPVFPDGGVAVADLDIDGATDIGAAIVDADLSIVDDGAGGTNRKTTAARLKTYAGYDGAISTLDIDGGTDIGAALADADEIIVDDGGGGTNRRCDMSRVKTYIGDNTPAFLVTLSGNQEIANSTLTKITFDTEAFDSDGKFASNKFTPTVAGKYFIVLSGRMSGFGDGEEFNLRFQKNGSAHNFGDLKIVSSGSNPLFLAANANLVVDLDADDFIEGYITHNVGAAANLDATYTFMAGYKINGA